MALTGKYELIKNEGVLEHMVASGFPEDLAKKSLENKNLEISISGNQVTISRGDGRTPPAYTLNQENEEKTPDGKTFKTKPTLNGDVLTVESGPEGANWKRVYTLVGSELTVVSSNTKPGVPDAKRIYKKL